MKKLFLSMFIMLMAVTAFSQEKLTFSQVILAEKLDKASLYATLREWVATTYIDSKEVIQMDDKDAGIIICLGVEKFKTPRGLVYQAFDGIIKYTLKLQAKDGRCKVELSNLIHDNYPNKSQSYNLGLITDAEIFKEKGAEKKFYNNGWNDVKEASKMFYETVLFSLKKKIEVAKPLIDSSEDW